MKIMIVGCGPMGVGLAQELSPRGHLIAVVDNDPSRLRRLGPTFKGKAIEGVGFDREVLLTAGIEKVDGLAALTDNDEVNLVVSRLATQVYRVPRVIAMLNDPGKADVYKRLGIQTISPTTWGVSQIAEALSYSPLDTVFSMGSGEVNLVATPVPKLLVGRMVRELTVSGEIHVASITREGKPFLPTLGTVFQEGDLVHIVVLASSAGRLRDLLGLA